MTDTPPPDGRTARAAGLLRWLPLGLIAAAAAVLFATGAHRDLTLDTLAAHRADLCAFVDARPTAAAAGFAALYAATIAVGLPIAVLFTVGGGFLFGTVGGGVLSVVGATLGALGVFLAARTAAGDAIARRAGPRLRTFEAGFRRDAFSYLLVLRLVPLFPFWLVNIVPAALGVRLRTFAAATAIGMLPGAFVYASVGAGLGSVIDQGGRPDLGILFTPQVLLPILGLALLALLPVLVRRFRRTDPA
jgi:uncharacterized membrane protein YdjX (TVP38/TMEM64 family)